MFYLSLPCPIGTVSFVTMFPETVKLIWDWGARQRMGHIRSAKRRRVFEKSQTTPLQGQYALMMNVGVYSACAFSTRTFANDFTNSKTRLRTEELLTL